MCVASHADVIRASSRFPAPRTGGLREEPKERLRGRLKRVLHVQNCRYLLLRPLENAFILHDQ